MVRIVLAVAAIVFLPLRVHAGVPFAIVRGDVRDRANGSPIPGAAIRFTAIAGNVVTMTTGREDGTFEIDAPAAGSYRLRVVAPGYAASERTIAIVADSFVHVVLVRESAMREIAGTVSRARTASSALSSASVDASALSGAAALRASDGLEALPGLTTSGDHLAPGGDAYLSIRGLRAGEGQALLDGHPIGPIGIAPMPPDTDGSIAGFNFADAPYFALRSANATFGASAIPSFGIAGIGGSIDLRTLDPTPRFDASIAQGIGSQGRAFTSLRATGTTGTLSYALAGGVSGTYGLFNGSPIAETGLRGTDFTSATLRGLTYDVSGDYLLRNDLTKIVYTPLRDLSIVTTLYDATSWSDKTGEGDNDFNPSSFTLANAPVGASATCPHGVLVTANAGPACISPQAYAMAASGPAGGGPGAWQALRNQDGDVRISASAGVAALTFETFVDRYALLYHRDASVVSGPEDDFLDRWSTAGTRLGLEIANEKNDASIGLAALSQTLTGDATAPDGTFFQDAVPSSRFVRSVLLEDAYAPNAHLSVSGRALLESSTFDTAVHFDPDISVTYRPTRSDTFRATAGHSSEEPSLESSRVNLLPTGALNPDCGDIAHATASAPAYVNVGSGPAAGVRAETDSDLELGYARALPGDGTAGITVYDTNLENRIVTADGLAGSLVPSSSIGAIDARISEFCGVTPAPNAVDFTLGRSINAATGRLRGIEVAGRARVAAHVAVDYAYDLQSIVLNDLPASVLMADPTLVNGTQAFEIPLHKEMLAIDITTSGGISVRLEGHAVDPNNPQQLPGYAYADASVAAAVSKRVKVNLAVSNVFNSHAQTYGLVGSGLPYATNSYNEALGRPFVQPFNERYGLAPATATVSATLRL